MDFFVASYKRPPKMSMRRLLKMFWEFLEIIDVNCSAYAKYAVLAANNVFGLSRRGNCWPRQMQ
jgi:hypothetical protein